MSSEMLKIVIIKDFIKIPTQNSNLFIPLYLSLSLSIIKHNIKAWTLKSSDYTH